MIINPISREAHQILLKTLQISLTVKLDYVMWFNINRGFSQRNMVYNWGDEEFFINQDSCIRHYTDGKSVKTFYCTAFDKIGKNLPTL